MFYKQLSNLFKKDGNYSHIYKIKIINYIKFIHSLKYVYIQISLFKTDSLLSTIVNNIYNCQQ